MGLFSLLKDKGGPEPSVALAELSSPTTRAKSAFFAAAPGAKHARFEDSQGASSDRRATQ